MRTVFLLFLFWIACFEFFLLFRRLRLCEQAFLELHEAFRELAGILNLLVWPRLALSLRDRILFGFFQIGECCAFICNGKTEGTFLCLGLFWLFLFLREYPLRRCILFYSFLCLLIIFIVLF